MLEHEAGDLTAIVEAGVRVCDLNERLAEHGHDREAYTDGKAETNFTLGPREAVTLRHRILILSGTTTPEQMAAQYAKFTGEVE